MSLLSSKVLTTQELHTGSVESLSQKNKYLNGLTELNWDHGHHGTKECQTLEPSLLESPPIPLEA